VNGPNVTSDGRPVNYPSNPLTDAMFAGLSAARGRGGVSASPPPAVRSNSWGQETPLSPDEIAELDARYAEMIAPPPTATAAGSVTGHVTPVYKNTTVPNFQNIQGIDLERNVIRVDGMEFPLDADDARQVRLMCVDCVLNAVVAGLRDLLSTYGISPDLIKAQTREAVLERGQETAQVQDRLGAPGEGTNPESAVAEVEPSDSN